jgi:hypothetical protein
VGRTPRLLGWQSSRWLAVAAGEVETHRRDSLDTLETTNCAGNSGYYHHRRCSSRTMRCLYLIHSLGHLFTHREQEYHSGRLASEGKTFVQVLQKRILTLCLLRLQLLCKGTKLLLHLLHCLGICNHSGNFFCATYHAIIFE